MKRTLLALLALALFFPMEAAAQSSAVVYSLPQTVLSLKVKAQREAFTAGPYAAYAQKYLGVAAKAESGVTVTPLEITLTPYVEADPKARFAVTIPEKSQAGFLQLCAQGLVVMADNYTGKPTPWHFQSQAGDASFAGIDPLGNLGTETTTLYKAVRTDDGYERVPVTQDNVVEKSPDRKAADAAATIFSLREKRQQIATGDTDATFSGEALQAAIDEITRLEERYLSLFYGIKEVSIEEKTFDIVPDPSNTSGRYVAFNINGTLQPGSVKGGTGFTLELQKEDLSSPEPVGDTRAREAATVRYRIPAITRCRLYNGNTLLLETRVPVYQFGEEASFPLNALLTK